MKSLNKTQGLPIINPNVCCVECKHFFIATATTGYGEYTPGSDFSMACSAGQWEFDIFGLESDYRECMLSAKRCPLFEDRGGK